MAENKLENIIKVAATTHAPIETAVLSALAQEPAQSNMPVPLQLALGLVAGGLLVVIAEKIFDGVTS